MEKILTIIAAIVVCTNLGAQVRHFGPDEGLNTGEVTQVVELPNGQILVNNVGTFKIFDGTVFVPVYCEPDRCYKLPVFVGYGHMWQGDSLLWLRDYHYMYLFDARERVFRYDVEARLKDRRVSLFAHGETGDESLPDKRWVDLLRRLGVSGQLDVCAICEDGQGGTWVGTQGQNLFYISPARPQAQTMACPNDRAAQVVCPLPDGRLLVGTDEGLWMREKSGAYSCLKREENALYHSALADSKGRIWISSQGGVDCYDGVSVRRYDAGDVEGFLHNHVLFVRELIDGRLLVCNNMHELGVLDVAKGEFACFNDKIPALGGYRVIIDALPLKDKRHVLGLTQNGAFLLDYLEEKVIPMSNLPSDLSSKFNCALQDEEGKLWIGTQNGLAVMSSDMQSSRIVVRGCVRGVVSDAWGRIWVSTSDGLVRIASWEGVDGDAVCFFSTNDGIPDEGISERGLVMMADSVLCVASSSGVTMLHAGLFDSLRYECVTELVGFSVNGRSLPLSAAPVELPYEENNVRIKFSALNYSVPEHTHYRYRLLGLSDSWTYSNEGIASFTALRHGDYVFEAQAAVLDGTWGRSVRKEFEINTPFWLSWWAMAVYLSISLGGVYLLIAWYLRKKKRELAAENDERVNRLFELREEARRHFAQSVKITPKDIVAGNREEELMERVMTAVERNMGNSGYTVDHLASDVCMSRASLYRAMQNLLGITPNEFVRNVRLKQAAQMLAETDLSINDISALVGFGTPRYFTLHFKRMFGVLPSRYRDGRSGE